MSLQLDHAVIAVNDLDTAIQNYRSLGFTVVRGGVHANHATHNALITFANETYLELLAATGNPIRPGVIDFSVMLQHGEGLVGFALRSHNLAADAARLRAHGFAVGDIIPGERRREDGTLVQWKLMLLDDGFAPFLIEDVTPRARRILPDQSITSHANAAAGLRAVEIAVRDFSGAQDRYSTLFGISSRPSETNASAIGDIILRETATADTLYALHLTLSDDKPHVFPPEQTHGVRFEHMPSSR